jgi:hypothetical protein
VKTDDLIETLARNVEPTPKPRWRLRLALVLCAGLAAALAIVAGGLQVRPDIGAAQIPVLLKAMFAATAAAAVLPLAARLMRPGRPIGWRTGVVVAFAVAAAIAACVALLGEMPERRLEAWIGGGFPWCLVLVPVLGAPTAAGLIWLMRDFAPTRLTATGAAIGGLSGGVGAMAYSMYCPIDSIAFVTTWYVVAIAICAALGATIGAHLLRW